MNNRIIQYMENNHKNVVISLFEILSVQIHNYVE